MSLKLLADKYIELNIQSINEINGENCNDFIQSNHHVFLYCKSGKLQLQLNYNIIDLNENDVYLLPQRSDFKINKGNFSAYFLEFNGASVDELLMNSPFAKGNLFLHDDSHLEYYFYKIYHAYHEAEFLSIRCLGILYELFYELTKKSKIQDVEFNNQQKHIEMAKEYIAQNYHLDITISDVAKKVGVTSNYLANIFAKYVGQTPKAYLTSIRMEQAKKMLATHKYKVKDVGLLVGYKNQLHFSSEFKKNVGVSPNQFAKVD